MKKWKQNIVKAHAAAYSELERNTLACVIVVGTVFAVVKLLSLSVRP